MKYSAVLAATLVAVASAEDITITVAKSGLTFEPKSVTAKKGDRLVFNFANAGHDVVLGSSDKGKECTAADKSTKGFLYSSMITPSSDKTFVVDVTSEDPMWFFCSVSTHCAMGMYGSVNAASSATYDATDKKSSQLSGNAVGGQLVKDVAAATGSSSGASSTATGSSSNASASGGSSTMSGSMMTGTSTASSASASKSSSAGKVEVGLFALVGGLVAAFL